jgi:mRNA-degrading endonuclease toxin of MazEF toxin-antitoxin module
MPKQIRTIDKLRLKRRLGKINEETLNEIEKAILIHLEIEI